MIEDRTRQWHQKETDARERLATVRANLQGTQDTVLECVGMVTKCRFWQVRHARLGRHPSK